MSRKIIQSKTVVFVVLFLINNVVLAIDDRRSLKENQNKGFLTFGFLPMESPVSLFKRFAPLREYLSTAIQQDIRLETAKDFAEFALRTEKRKYDIVFTAPHMALKALDGDNYEIAATFTRPLRAVFVVHQKSDLKKVVDITNLAVATPPDEAIVTMVGKEYLKSQKLMGVDYKTYRTHNAAYSAVLGGETQVAMVSNFIARKAINNNHPLKIIARSNPFPGIGILIAKDLPEKLKNHIKKAIWTMKELPHGNKILKKISQPGYGEANKNQFEILRPFVLSTISEIGR